MSGQVLVSLFITIVLRNIVQVFAANDDGTVHLGGNNATSEDPAANRDQASEGALLVYCNR